MKTAAPLRCRCGITISVLCELQLASGRRKVAGGMRSRRHNITSVAARLPGHQVSVLVVDGLGGLVPAGRCRVLDINANVGHDPFHAGDHQLADRLGVLFQVRFRRHLDQHLVVDEVDDPVAGPPQEPQREFCPVSSQTLERRVVPRSIGRLGPQPPREREHLAPIYRPHHTFP